MLQVIPAKQTPIRMFTCRNHSSQMRHYQVCVLYVVLYAVHGAVWETNLLFRNQNKKSKMKQRKSTFVCLKPFKSFFHLSSHHPSMVLPLSSSHSSSFSLFRLTFHMFGVEGEGNWLYYLPVSILSVLELFTFTNLGSVADLQVQCRCRRKVWLWSPTYSRMWYNTIRCYLIWYTDMI